MTVNLEDYLRLYPDREVQVCMNAQHSAEDRRLRVTILKLLRPYRPRTLGVYVVDTLAEALARKIDETPMETGEPKAKKLEAGS